MAEHFIRNMTLKIKEGMSDEEAWALNFTNFDSNTKARNASRTAHFGEHFRKTEATRGRCPHKNTPKNTASGSSTNDGPLQAAIQAQNEVTLKKLLGKTIPSVTGTLTCNSASH